MNKVVVEIPDWSLMQTLGDNNFFRLVLTLELKTLTFLYGFYYHENFYCIAVFEFFKYLIHDKIAANMICERLWDKHEPVIWTQS